jgi:hypothetical protein
MLDENRKIGIGLCVVGLVCFILGIALFFDRTLLVLANLAFIGGLALILGPMKTFRFFFRADKFLGSLMFFAGFGMQVFGWGFFGFLAQLYGIYKLFMGFLPNVIVGLKSFVPGADWLFSLPGFRQISEYAYDQRRLPV